MTAKIKQIGGSWSIDLDIGDNVQVLVNDEVIHTDSMDSDMNIAFYLKRRNKPNSWQ